MKFDELKESLDRNSKSIVFGLIVLILVSTTVGAIIAIAQYTSINGTNERIWRKAHREMVEAYYPPKPDPISSIPFWTCFDENRPLGERLRNFETLVEARSQYPQSLCFEVTHSEVDKWTNIANETRYSLEKWTIVGERRELAEEYALELAAQRRKEFREELLQWITIFTMTMSAIAAMVLFLLRNFVFRRPS